MSRDPIPRSRPFDLYHASACDDAPVSHGHRPNKGLRIIIADDHPVVLTGIEMVLSSFADFTCSVVARAENALCPGDRPDNKTDFPGASGRTSGHPPDPRYITRSLTQ